MENHPSQNRKWNSSKCCLPAGGCQGVDAFLVFRHQPGSDLGGDVDEDVVVGVGRSAQRPATLFDRVEGGLTKLHPRLRQLVRLAGHVPRWEGVILQNNINISQCYETFLFLLIDSSGHSQ